MPTFYGSIDLSKNEIRNAVAQNLGSAPASPGRGQFYFNSTDNTLYWWDGSQWIAAKAAAGAVPAGSVTTQAVGDAPVVGVSTNFAREDHKHGREAFGNVTAETAFGGASGNGSAATIARSDHAHGNPTHDANAHSAIPISALAPAGSPGINMNTFPIANIPLTPTNSSDAASKYYVDMVSQGLSWKDSVRVATTGNITLSGNQTLDGVLTATNDRVLVKNQTTASQNGIYMASPTTWQRTLDGAQGGNSLEGAALFVEEGTTQADTAWICTTNAPVVVGTTNLTFAQFGAGATYIAGAGLSLNGNTFDIGAGAGIVVQADNLQIDPTVVAQAGTVFTAGAGLTGGGSLFANRTFDVVAGDTSLTVAADSVIVNTGVIASRAYVDSAVGAGLKKFAATLTGTASPETVTHNLNTRDVLVAVYNGATPYTAVEVDWDAATVNTVTIRYSPNLGAGYRVVVMG